MTTTLAFDVYGTLIDPFEVSSRLNEYVGDKAARFARIWRDKQIEYLFRRALMRRYENFSTCTRRALDFTDERLRTRLTGNAKDALMATYRVLPAYPGTSDALQQLGAKNCLMYAFSNGQPDDLEHLLENAGLNAHLDGIVSVHDVRSYKPDPAMYRHFLDSTGSEATDTWLVSGNAFDVLGAQAAGWNTAWLKRDPTAIFDPWDVEPTTTVTELGELATLLFDGNS